MIMKVPTNDWSSDQFEYIIEEDESLSDIEDEQDFSEYLWMENEEEFDKIVSKILFVFVFFMFLSLFSFYCLIVGIATS